MCRRAGTIRGLAIAVGIYSIGMGNIELCPVGRNGFEVTGAEVPAVRLGAMAACGAK